MSITNDMPVIAPVAPHQRAEALRLVFSRLPEADLPSQVNTLLASIDSGAIRPQSLLGAYRDGRLAGAILSQTQSGKTAILWSPRLISGEPPSTAESLLSAACTALEKQRLRMTQALMSVDSESDQALLRTGGFEFLADLLYLVSVETDFPRSKPSSPLEFETYCPENHGRLAQIVETTYDQTLDCPALNGVREIGDVLIGYRSQGKFNPGNWMIVRHDGRDVGCLILSDYPHQGNVELVYMGIVSTARGHGWGIDVTRHAQWLAALAGRPRLVLAVDARNGPAIKMYAAVGFRAWDRRRVFVKVFS